MNTTTKRYARTLAEAFPQDRAEWLEKPRQSLTDQVLGVILATIIGCSLAAVLVHWASQ